MLEKAPELLVIVMSLLLESSALAIDIEGPTKRAAPTRKIERNLNPPFDQEDQASFALTPTLADLWWVDMEQLPEGGAIRLRTLSPHQREGQG